MNIGLNGRLLFILVFIAINIVAILIMLQDKIRSRRVGTERISEGMMFFLATVFGSLGLYLGMFAFRHKTRKWYFLFGIPLLFLENVALLYCLYLWYNMLIVL